MLYQAVPDLAATDEDTIVAIDVLANDLFHQKGAIVTAATIRDGAPGAVTIDGNRILFDPSAYDYLGAGEVATVVIDYTADGIGKGAKGDSSDSTITIVITGTTRLLSYIFTTPDDDLFAAPSADVWTVLGMAGDDDLAGGIFGDHIDGEDGDDVLRGRAGDDRLVGGAGADSLIGEGGSDELAGGAGDDIYYVQDGADAVIEAAGEGSDFVYASVSYTLTDHVDNLMLTGAALLDGNGNGLDNRIYGNIAGNRLDGGDGADTLAGRVGDDHLLGGNGDDTLTGGSGVDVLEGGAGNDTYDYRNIGDALVEADGAGNDLVWAFIDFVLPDHVEELRLAGEARTGTGNALANFVYGTSLEDVLYGLDGNDTLRGQSGIDSIFGGAGDDLLYGGYGDDVMEGGEGVDRINGELGNDLIDGGAGADQLYGREGADNLVGGEGDDAVVGGIQRDVLTGGAGADRFVFDDGDTTNARLTADRITDFSAAAGDKLHLLYFDADRATAADDRFAFIGRNAFSGAAGQLRYDVVGPDAYVCGDVDGDRIADFWIKLDGVSVLSEANFVL
ncbi:MAG TPA: calcium-binding protein [Allosphingosinicella sp.]|nr:calcium-binding protein [Allosphingosinicella sp.]